MKMGAEPKKIVALVGLVAVAAIVYWMNSTDSPTATPVARPAADAVAAVQGPGGSSPKAVRRREASGRPGSVGDHVWKIDPNLDTSKIDPTIRLDLLAKVQAVGVEGGGRNIFQAASDPALVQAREAELKKKIDEAKNVGPIHISQPPTTASAASTQVPQPVVPIVTPINLKYYGYSTKRSDGEKKAFFLDGEEIIVAAEGDIIKKQYKVVRIGVNSVQMEDTASKSSQTLPIQQDAAPV